MYTHGNKFKSFVNNSRMIFTFIIVWILFVSYTDLFNLDTFKRFRKLLYIT